MKNAKGKNVWNWPPVASLAKGGIPAFAGMTGRAGSALILTVVLTSLLAIIGIMFVMAANMDKLTTSSVSINKELNFAVDSVVAQISQQLILDVPGVAPSTNTDYYDYPWDNDEWLASLEPRITGTTYEWPQISDVTGYIGCQTGTGWSVPAADRTRNIEINNSTIIEDHEAISLNNGNLTEQLADADGDGVADSKWIELEADSNQPAMTKSGKRIYAAIRVIDNGGMVNVNTVYSDPGTADQREGDRLTDIYIDGFVKVGTDATTNNPIRINNFIDNRGDPGSANQYNLDVSRRIENPNTTSRRYTLYDISEELSLRNRFMLYNKFLYTRLEARDPSPGCLYNSLRSTNEQWTPVDDTTTSLPDWKDSMNPEYGGLDPNDFSSQYAFRKLLTTYNFDRIMNPEGAAGFADGNEMPINYNSDYYTSPSIFAQELRDFIEHALANTTGSTMPATDRSRIATQLAVNIADYTDPNTDTDVTSLSDGTTPYYGFEAQPFISEIGVRIDANACNLNERHYAVELYNPFNVNIPLDDFQLVLSSGNTISLTGHTINANTRLVILKDSGTFTVVGDSVTDPQLVLSDNYSPCPVATGCSSFTIFLVRTVNSVPVYVDRQDTDASRFVMPPNSSQFFERDDDGGHILYQHVSDPPLATGSLGSANNSTTFSNLGGQFNLLPFNGNRFVTVGDISRMLTVGSSTDPTQTMGRQLEIASTEDTIRINLRNPDYRNLFQYLTILDPAHDGIDNDGDGSTDERSLQALAQTPEVKVAGRININTAPWFVIAQLPWVYEASRTPNYELAKAVVAYRDKQNLSPGPGYTSRQIGTGINNVREDTGFESIGELATVIDTSAGSRYSIDYYGYDGADLAAFPDLTPSDGSAEDFEERDVIFSRISNLVTVRSDVFTAYILVRLGEDGPQKRVIAILDRSDVYPNPGGGSTGKVKIVALWPVPDSR